MFDNITNSKYIFLFFSFATKLSSNKLLENNTLISSVFTSELDEIKQMKVIINFEELYTC